MAVPSRNIFLVISALLLAIASDELSARRSLRIAFDAWSEAFPLGSPLCPGTTLPKGSVLVDGPPFNTLFEFSGDQGTTYLADAFCQVSIPYSEGLGTDEYLNEESFPPDEAGLSGHIGPNTDNAVTAIRYTFLDRNRFSENPPPTGFQWAFYFFPDDVVVVALYGLQDVTLSGDHHFIRWGNFDAWNGERDGFNGDHFCFEPIAPSFNFLGLVGRLDADFFDADSVSHACEPEPSVFTIEPAVTVNELAVGVSVRVTRSGALYLETSVNYESVDVTAIGGEDYGPRSGRTLFFIGDTERSIGFNITADELDEPPETFNVIISGPADILNDVSVVTIIDNLIKESGFED